MNRAIRRFRRELRKAVPNLAFQTVSDALDSLSRNTKDLEYCSERLSIIGSGIHTLHGVHIDRLNYLYNNLKTLVES